MISCTSACTRLVGLSDSLETTRHPGHDGITADTPEILNNVCLEVPTRNLRHRKLLQVSLGHTNYRNSSFIPGTLTVLNQLNKDPRFDLFCSSTRTVKTLISREPTLLVNYLFYITSLFQRLVNYFCTSVVAL